MRRYLGIDVGTSAVKVLLVDAQGATIGEAGRALAVSRPHPGWSEQHPDDWWTAVATALDALAAAHPADLAAVAGIGLTGQMHGAVLLGADDRPLRSAILWNDGRAAAEAKRLVGLGDDLAARVGVRAMAGITAPKIAWLAAHEPALFDRLACLLSPKDWIRLRLTGERLTDPSDGSGTWLLDAAARDWYPPALAAVGLTRAQLPAIVESTVPAGRLRPEIARAWGFSADVVVAGGGGDSPVGAVGLGLVEEGVALANLGTSALLLAPSRSHRPHPASLVHAFCHALPERWYQMAAMLNGASALAWAAGLVGREVGDLVAAVEAEDRGPGDLVFLPYLTGERTPHDDANARGVLFGLTPQSGAVEVGRAVMEGVAYTFGDGLAALAAAGTKVSAIEAMGGGARSDLWAKILATVTGVPVIRRAGGDRGPAFGAARLARIACGEGSAAEICTPAPEPRETLPVAAWADAYGARLERFRRLYPALKAEFAQAATE